MGDILKRKALKLGDRRYENISYIDRGGSGEVYRATQDGLPVALKVFFPFFERRQLKLVPEIASTQLPGLITQSIDFQRREYEFISSISHPNIVRAYDSATAPLTKAEQQGIRKELGLADGSTVVSALPVLISEFVDGEPLDSAIANYSLSASELAYALARVAEALDYLHVHHCYMHTDVKANNILVRRDIREPILIDFALCKNFDFAQVEATQGTRLLGDWDLFPQLPEEHPLKRAKEQGATRDEIRRLAFPSLDLFQFGKMLKSIHSACEKVLEPREMRYLRVLEWELEDWDRVSQWEPGELSDRVHRLSPAESTPFGVPELAAPGVPEHTLVIPGQIAVPLTSATKPVINTPSFRRLSFVNQLSLLDVVYPGSGYKRQVHVLYAYELARQMVAHLYSSPRFRYFFDERAVQQLLLVSLLHDINHFPFLHTFQESDIDEFDRVALFDILCDGDLTGETAAKIPTVYDILENYDIDRKRFKRLVYGDFEGQPTPQDQIISSIVNSGLDVDKLSYLRLDAYFTGVPYGQAIDIPTLLKAATVAPIDDKGRYHLAFGDRAISALEHVVFTRYWNFRAIYWHHTNRAIMAMLLSVVRSLYGQGNLHVSEYIADTAFRSDYEAVRYLDRQYTQENEGERSILHGLDRDRSVVYKRLYTFHPATEASDRGLYQRLQKLDPLTSEVAFRGRLAEGLSDLAGKTVMANDVLVDVPRRDLDLGGAVFIAHEGSVQPLSEMSKPVGYLAENYTELSQRARIFIAPWLRETLRGGAGRLPSREDLRKLIAEALDGSRGPSEFR